MEALGGIPNQPPSLTLHVFSCFIDGSHTNQNYISDSYNARVLSHSNHRYYSHMTILVMLLDRNVTQTLCLVRRSHISAKFCTFTRGAIHGAKHVTLIFLQFYGINCNQSPRKETSVCTDTLIRLLGCNKFSHAQRRHIVNHAHYCSTYMHIPA